MCLFDLLGLLLWFICDTKDKFFHREFTEKVQIASIHHNARSLRDEGGGKNIEEGVILSAQPSLGDGFQWIMHPRLVHQTPGRSIEDMQRAVGMTT